jgi:hypothetical protein
MPRGGRRKGSGRKRLGKTRMTVHVNPDVADVLGAIAALEQSSKGAVIEKMMHPDSVITPSPHFTGPHYFRHSPWIYIEPSNPQKE